MYLLNIYVYLYYYIYYIYFLFNIDLEVFFEILESIFRDIDLLFPFDILITQ